ncbi:hypothetical protein K432DRAFT_383958 [Lepidopterella palustris CBS 459.81]|uniref:Uncharacterized protein n=1 Tax=Lepidopterella palustris CBS 459.81 TaxID=1314670 RepID=A0A8E2E6J6_9PEZI|nr:hypothetical protein K432DRAFT_383958 [Lepidopterella palustris CBS 459.81]
MHAKFPSRRVENSLRALSKLETGTMGNGMSHLLLSTFVFIPCLYPCPSLPLFLHILLTRLVPPPHITNTRQTPGTHSPTDAKPVTTPPPNSSNSSSSAKSPSPPSLTLAPRAPFITPNSVSPDLCKIDLTRSANGLTGLLMGVASSLLASTAEEGK